MGKLRALYYVNQFYAGIGGEDKADIDLRVFEGGKGPAQAIENYFDNEMEVVETVACGDNYINKEKNFEEIFQKIKKITKNIDPDVFIAGPAFNAGRYGTACAKLVDKLNNDLNIPGVTGMYYENPAIKMYLKDNYIIETSETAAGMKKALPKMAKLALKLAKGEEIGPAREEGYIPRGYRYNEWHEKTGAKRTVDLLLKKLQGKDYETEVPLRGFENVEPAEPLNNLNNKKIALITTGGLVPKGNPDNLKQAFSETYNSYSIKELNSLSSDQYESIHGGFDTTIVNADPNRLVPLDMLRVLENEDIIGEIYENYLVTSGIGTNVKNSKEIGKSMIEELKNNGVDAVILTST